MADVEPPIAAAGLDHSLAVTVDLEGQMAAVGAALVLAQVSRQAGLLADGALVELGSAPDGEAQIGGRTGSPGGTVSCLPCERSGRSLLSVCFSLHQFYKLL